MGTGAIVVAVIVLVIGIRLAMDPIDRSRIRQYVVERGGVVESIRWNPFGRGWFGEKSDRIYEVVYRDDKGRRHDATCKTSLFTGVYWTEDTTAATDLEPGPRDAIERPPDEAERLRQENARLREQLDRLEGKPAPRERGD